MNLSMKTSGDFMYLIDTYAWIEYFIGSKKGEQVKQIIENKKHFDIIPGVEKATVTPAELKNKM